MLSGDELETRVTPLAEVDQSRRVEQVRCIPNRHEQNFASWCQLDQHVQILMDLLPDLFDYLRFRPFFAYGALGERLIPHQIQE